MPDRIETAVVISRRTPYLEIGVFLLGEQMYIHHRQQSVKDMVFIVSIYRGNYDNYNSRKLSC